MEMLIGLALVAISLGLIAGIVRTVQGNLRRG